MSAHSLANNAKKLELAADLARLDEERFTAQINHSDNATHLKSSGNLYYWSEKRGDAVSMDGFVSQIMVEYGCPHKGKGPWDGLGAMAKTKLRRYITNGTGKCRTPSGRIRNALEAAQHFRAIFGNGEW